ncbi:MAG: LysR substrate-binding domain-containing protein [Rhodospirillales bacterium]|nr:LysR substrate-binding domain-containing protein [Rhodospirillales bacterium]
MVKRRLPSLNALRAFEAVGRIGRMTEAAEELGVTHGAISHQVSQLEQTLGAPLFEGPKNRRVLTAAGKALLADLTAGFDLIETGVRKLAEDGASALDVSCLGTFTLRWLIPRLHRFQEAHPGIEVRLSASDAPVDFARGAYEVAIRVTDHPLPPLAPITHLFEERIGPVLAPALAARFDLRQPSDLEGVPILHTRTRSSAWADWAAAVGWKTGGFSGTIYEHFYFLLEAAVAGLGATVAPWPLVMDDVAAGRLLAPFGFVPSGLRYIAVRKPKRSRLAQSFCAWLAQEAEATPSEASRHGSRS